MTDSRNTGNANGMEMFFAEVTTGVSGMSQNESGMAEKKELWYSEWYLLHKKH